MAQIGTVNIQTQNNGVVSVPVFAIGDSGSSVHEIWRVETAGGTGFIPLVATTDAAIDYLRVQTQNNGVLAVHNDASLVASATVSSTLNSGSATLWVYEDTNQDGVAENIEEITVLDGTNSYDLTSFAGGTGNDYWWYVQTVPASETSRVEIQEIELEV